MKRASLALWIVCGLLSLCGSAAAQARMALDPVHTRLGFELTTRWGQILEGVFPRFDGEVAVLPDGRHQVTLRMYTREVEIIGRPRYTTWARSGMFFESEKYPVVMFVSRPYDPATLAQGGALAGDLTIRGVTRPETLDVAPAVCAQAAADCDVVATGAVRRSDYDMDNWRLAVNDRVVFVLRARLDKGAQP